MDGSYSLFIKVYNVIHGALEKAVELGMIPRNPCKGVAFPKDDRKDVWALTKEEQQRFIAALDGEYYRTMLLTYLYTGMRAGECIPLQWKDVDLSKHTIRINKKRCYTTTTQPTAASKRYKTSAKPSRASER